MYEYELDQIQLNRDNNQEKTNVYLHDFFELKWFKPFRESFKKELALMRSFIVIEKKAYTIASYTATTEYHNQTVLATFDQLRLILRQILHSFETMKMPLEKWLNDADRLIWSKLEQKSPPLLPHQIKHVFRQIEENTKNGYENELIQMHELLKKIDDAVERSRRYVVKIADAMENKIQVPLTELSFRCINILNGIRDEIANKAQIFQENSCKRSQLVTNDLIHFLSDDVLEQRDVATADESIEFQNQLDFVATNNRRNEWAKVSNDCRDCFDKWSKLFKSNKQRRQMARSIYEVLDNYVMGLLLSKGTICEGSYTLDAIITLIKPIIQYSKRLYRVEKLFLDLIQRMPGISQNQSNEIMKAINKIYQNGNPHDDILNALQELHDMKPQFDDLLMHYYQTNDVAPLDNLFFSHYDKFDRITQISARFLKTQAIEFESVCLFLSATTTPGSPLSSLSNKRLRLGD